MDFESEVLCLECKNQFWMSLDDRPKCPVCKGNQLMPIEVDEPDPEE